MTSGNHDSAQRLGFARRPDRRCRRPPAHRPGSTRRAARSSRTRTDGRGLRASPTSSPTSCAIALEWLSAPTRRSLDAAMRRVRDRRLPARAPGGRDGARLRHRRHSVAERARHLRRRGVRASGSSTFDGVDYVALGHLHGRHTLIRACATPARRSPTPSPRHDTARAAGWSTSDRRSSRGRRSSTRRCRVVSTWSAGDVRRPAEPTPAHAGVERAGCTSRSPTRDGRRDAMERLRRRFPHCLVIAFEPEGVTPVRPDATAAQPAAGPSDTEVLDELLRRHPRLPPDADEAGSAAATRAMPAEDAEDRRVAMRVHRLEITAFGPFPGTEVVDFERAQRRGPLPPDRTDRRGQDQHPRRDLLRALRRRPG